VTVRFTAALRRRYRLRPGANVEDFLVGRHRSAEPWRIIFESPVTQG
jgi:hypothetical protein